MAQQYRWGGLAATEGSGIGTVGVGMGAIGLITAVVLLADPLSPVAVIGFLVLIAFNAVVGWRLYSLSRVRAGQTAPAAMVRGRSVG